MEFFFATEPARAHAAGEGAEIAVELGGKFADIGGPAMIRAAAKNHAFVNVVVDPEDYEALLAELDAMDVKKLWKHYDDKGQPERLRNYFMERYLPLVRYNSERIYARLPDEVDIEDLMSAGLFGLMDAIDAFDLERGVKFETYCAPRIRGAILDELRTMDWVPRLVRSRTAKVDGARNALIQKFGREPTKAEIAQHLGVDSEEYKKIDRDGSPVGVVSLSRNWRQSDGNRELREIDVIKDSRQVNPLGETQRRDLKDLVTKGLSRAERLIVVLYYYEEMTMKEIGTTLDLSAAIRPGEPSCAYAARDARSHSMCLKESAKHDRSG